MKDLTAHLMGLASAGVGLTCFMVGINNNLEGIATNQENISRTVFDCVSYAEYFISGFYLASAYCFLRR